MMQELNYIRCGDYIFPIFAYRRKPDLLVDGGAYTEIISRSIIPFTLTICVLAVSCGRIWPI